MLDTTALRSSLRGVFIGESETVHSSHMFSIRVSKDFEVVDVQKLEKMEQKMTTLSLASIKASSIAKDTEDKITENREKAMLLFTFQLLVDKGYIDTAATFASECSLNLDQFVMCENIDLNSVFVDFEAYYNLRFQRIPQYFRKVCSNGSQAPNGSLLSCLRSHTKNSAKSSYRQKRGLIADGESPSLSDHHQPSLADPCLTITAVSNEIPMLSNSKLLKPISGLDFPNEDTRSFAEALQREIISTDLSTKWDDIIGLENAKTVLMESLIYRKQFSDFFGQGLSPWRGLLLYGPPGTGKTLLAKAVASECDTTFFNISSSSIVSKWRGDSEKIVKVLFDLAKYHAPSTIFFDEFDAIASSRDTSGESDASRRLKSELLQQMDGLLSANQTDQPIFLLAATNLPWEIDSAMLRRMEKRIYVPLPELEDRFEMIKLNLSKTAQGIHENSSGRNGLVCDIDLAAVAVATEGYSGSDIQQFVKEAVVLKFRQNLTTKSRKLVLKTEDILHSLQSVSPTVTGHVKDKFSTWESNSGKKPV